MFEIDLLTQYKKEFSTPIRGRILDGKIKPYFSRKQIDKGAIKTKPICYVSDKVDLYFLQEKGTGQVRFKNKSTIYLRHIDFNGYPYYAIEKDFLKRKLMKKKEINEKSMRKYLKKYTSEQDEIFQTNSSYVFFKKYTYKTKGTLGLTLEKRRSVAVDQNSIPLGTPIFMSFNEPLRNNKLEKLMFAHDTKESIKGNSTIGVYLGAGKKAREEYEGLDKELNFWILIPNDFLHHDYLLKSKYL
jgi:membrane-bound lytic murein transglycosylase A